MFVPPTPQQRAAILSTVARADDGIALDAIARSLPSPPPENRQLKQWLDSFIDEELIFSSGSGRAALYLAVDPAALLETYGAVATATVAVDSKQPTADVPSPIPPPPPPSPDLPPSEPTHVPDRTTAPAPVQVAAAPVDSPTAATTDTLPKASDPDFAPMFELAVPTIIGARLHSTAVVHALRSQAGKNGKVGRGMGAYVKYALGRLDAFTPTDAEAYGITAAEFNAWKRQYSPTDERAVASSPVVPATANPTATTSIPAPAKRTLLGLDLPPVESEIGEESTSASARLTKDKPSPEDLLSGGPDLVKLTRFVHTGLFAAALAMTKSLLTWRRVVIAVGWAIALRLIVLPAYFPPPGLVLALIPVAGLPWVAFRWQDRAKQKRPFSIGEAVLFLLLGGWVGLWTARHLIYFAASLRLTLG